ncbi:MAG: hypothetical protein ACI8RD_003946 [Bacillariaceae sp.]|jgi:hypothetical protein
MHKFSSEGGVCAKKMLKIAKITGSCNVSTSVFYEFFIVGAFFVFICYSIVTYNLIMIHKICQNISSNY